MVNKIAFIFPGQGAQSVGMGKEFYDKFDIAKRVFDKADEVLGRSITKLCFEGPEEDLKQTQNTQPCILTTSLATLELIKEMGIKPDYVAGHSLGEYGALYAAGVFTLEEILKLIQKRADLMGQVKGGSMAAVLNCDEEVLKECMAQAGGYVAVANYNSPVQMVITGDDEAVKKTSELLLARGVKRVIPLAVSGAFHSEFMKKAGEEFGEFLKDFSPRHAQIPVITNVDAEITVDGFEEKMPKQIYSSVHWTQTIQKMIDEGVDTFIEIGPGKVLSGLNRKINSEVKTFNAFDLECLENIEEILCQKN